MEGAEPQTKSYRNRLAAAGIPEVEKIAPKPIVEIKPFGQTLRPALSGAVSRHHHRIGGIGGGAYSNFIQIGAYHLRHSFSGPRRDQDEYVAFVAQRFTVQCSFDLG